MVDIGTKFVMMTIHLLCPKKMKILQLTDLNMAIAAQRISSQGSLQGEGFKLQPLNLHNSAYSFCYNGGGTTTEWSSDFQKYTSNHVKNVTTSLLYPLTINMRGTFSTRRSMYSM